jgi:chromosome segregation ATPase
MTDRELGIDQIRDRLTGLLADWGTELSAVLEELEDKRARVAELEGRAADLEMLQKRIDGQDGLIATLTADAEEASRLRQEVGAKDVELERLSSELESKKELIRALRRDAESSDRLKSDAKLKDREIEALKAQLAEAAQRGAAFEAELETLRDAGARSDESAELDALRAELDARKTLIKSLRADQERATRLEASLEEKREVIEQLEASINRHAATIAELKRSAEAWKRKYQGLKSGNSAAAMSATVPALTETDVRAMEQLEKQGAAPPPDATIAIDMRRSLLEARRAAAQANAEK